MRTAISPSEEVWTTFNSWSDEIANEEAKAIS